MTDQLMLLPEASPAKTFQHRAGKPAYRAREVDFTKSCFPSLGAANHNGLYLKMSQNSLLEEMDFGFLNSSMTWPVTGMMRSGIIYQLPRSAPSITEIGFGLLPTPMKSCEMVVKKFTIQSQVKSQNAGHQKRLWPFLLKYTKFNLRRMNQITECLMGYPVNHTRTDH